LTAADFLVADRDVISLARLRMTDFGAGGHVAAVDYSLAPAPYTPVHLIEEDDMVFEKIPQPPFPRSRQRPCELRVTSRARRTPRS
jgi:hypothetical protein